MCALLQNVGSAAQQGALKTAREAMRKNKGPPCRQAAMDVCRRRSHTSHAL